LAKSNLSEFLPFFKIYLLSQSKTIWRAWGRKLVDWEPGKSVWAIQREELWACHQQPQPGLHTDLRLTCAIMELVENCKTPASLLTRSKLSNEAHIQQGHIYWVMQKGQRPLLFSWHYNAG